jgi:hypothetical protein
MRNVCEFLCTLYILIGIILLQSGNRRVVYTIIDRILIYIIHLYVYDIYMHITLQMVSRSVQPVLDVTNPICKSKLSPHARGYKYTYIYSTSYMPHYNAVIVGICIHQNKNKIIIYTCVRNII